MGIYRCRNTIILQRALPKQFRKHVESAINLECYKCQKKKSLLRCHLSNVVHVQEHSNILINRGTRVVNMFRTRSLARKYGSVSFKRSLKDASKHINQWSSWVHNIDRSCGTNLVCDKRFSINHMHTGSNIPTIWHLRLRRLASSLPVSSVDVQQKNPVNSTNRTKLLSDHIDKRKNAVFLTIHIFEKYHIVTFR